MPLNASADVYNFERDLASTISAATNPLWPPHPAISAPNPYTVVVQFSAPDGPTVG